MLHIPKIYKKTQVFLNLVIQRQTPYLITPSKVAGRKGIPHPISPKTMSPSTSLSTATSAILSNNYKTSVLPILINSFQGYYIHEFHETCHSVTSYFMKKDFIRCCDTTTPESIHTKDESKRGSAFAFIFGVN